MEILMEKSQALKLFLIAALLVVTPLLSTSLQSTYVYFIVNILIVVLGAEAGLFSFFLHSPDQKPLIIADHHTDKTAPHEFPDGVLDKCCSSDNIGEVEVTRSTPSIFFIEGGEAEAEEIRLGDDDVEGEETVEVSGQELYNKAETFIGNFYKQLKMQREESWKKLHDIYQKAF